jgi:hypothetical protein
MMNFLIYWFIRKKVEEHLLCVRVEETVLNKIIETIDRIVIGKQLTSIWEKKGDTGMRRSKLPRDAPFYERVLETTE